jgi:hypothetical protein
MKSLTNSYLASAPTAETAKDIAEAAMAQAFKIFDDAADSVLKAFAEKQGFDLSESKNYKRRFNDGYFRVFYPAIVMYMVWLDREGQKKALENLGNIFCSMMYGVAGYEILDSNLDEGKNNPSEILLCLSFIQECERLLLESFEFEAHDYDLLNRFKQLFLKAEIKEKRLRFVRSPYAKDRPADCGYKAVHAYMPFFLLLQKSGKQDQIDEYLQFFYDWGAPLQIMDDLIDLKDDLENGHYSYPTLGFEKELAEKSPGELAALIMSNLEHMTLMQRICEQLIESARKRGVKLGADLWGNFVDILESRLNDFFSMAITKINDQAKAGN